jgi:hypothetical protein
MMRKSQYFFLVIVFIFLLAIISIPKFINYVMPNENLEKVKTKDEDIEYRLIQGDFIVGKDFPEGYYDLTSEGINYFNGIQLSDGDTFLGLKLYERNSAQVTGKGAIKIKKSANLPVDKDGDVYKIRHSGFYRVGEQIKPGKYIVTYEIENDASLKEKPWFQFRSDDLQKNLGAYYFVDANQFEVEMKEKTFLEIYQSGITTNKRVTFSLTPIK